MPDMRYFDAEEKFLDYAWDVYKDYFNSRDNFLTQYRKISTDEKKNLFLMLVSFYKFLVRDGKYTLIENNEANYLDETYKFISLMSLIESLFSEDEFIDFYQWLTSRERRDTIFPITDNKILEGYYREYKERFGAAQKAIRFFSELDENAQNYLTARITINGEYKPAVAVAKKLYSIRSEFVHESRLILEFNEGRMFSKRDDKDIDSILSLKDLQLLFEHGVLHHFGITPDKTRI